MRMVCGVPWISAVACIILVGTQVVFGINVYDPTTSVCCDGRVVARATSGGSTCCGRHLLYDNATQLCCRDETTDVASVVSSDPFHRNAQLCCAGAATARLFPNSECCGRKVIDADRFLCCDGTVVRRHSSATRVRQVTACCANQGYDPVRQLCCDGKIHRKWGSTAACCGSQAFDVGQQGCCGNSVYTDPFGIQSCCNGQVYDALSEICCEDGLVSDPLRIKGCCGKGVGYVVFNETCCDGAVRPKTKSGVPVGALHANHSAAPALLPCCNNATYAQGSALCCQNVLVTLPKRHSGGGGGSKKEAAVATSGGHESYACCGKGFYHVRDELCCQGKVLKRLSPRTQCCGEFGYEEGEGSGETCCGESVLTAGNLVASEGERKCCKTHVIMVPHGRELCC